MTTNKRKHVAIPDEILREATLEITTDSLFRKAKELSALCNVEVGVIVQDKEKKEEFVWPSHREVEEKLVRFLNIPENNRNQKMYTHESFLTGIVSKKIEHVWKIHKKNEEKEIKHLMHKLIKGKITIKELDMMQTHGLSRLMLDQMNRVEKRIQELEKLEEQENQSFPVGNPHIHSLVQMLAPYTASAAPDSGVNASVPALELIEDFKNDEWFPGIMFDNQNIYPSYASDMGHYHSNAGNIQGNNMGNYSTAASTEQTNEGTTASTSGGNHMELEPLNRPPNQPHHMEVANSSVEIYDGFPDVEWPFSFLP
ncbi:hypothetical protein ACH5RR_005705 [Cinchona calisaya]|uniref:MADS-box domain-containing protein n=1 Tax=Cinchona calisaya TaxID=153742 RepID=A0ABD3ALZ9_9GENT